MSLLLFTMFASHSVFILLFYGLVAIEAQMSTPSAAPIVASCASKSNTSCEDCLQNVTCLWCMPTKQCLDYPVKNILPPSSVCPLKEVRWGLCWVNFQILIITLSVLAGVFLIVLFVCCLCCCRRRGTRNDDDDDDVRQQQQTRARNSRQKQRREEMQLRHDKIRQKYGLTKDNPYSRMDDKK
ncbi:PTTG1 interacting protein b [Dunckerocampus dactyliophorus]|uniref:PTTG1 interacting protein b n=1 Tax=Dunckerocampus dactyliophorus TaxID=161453 RepID=UPI002406E5D6|nr:PTTG1 interacting protein b [Dunckerocampus dactyliophorus]